MVEMCSYIFICFILDLHAAKTLTMICCATFGVNRSQRGIESCLFFDFLWKKDSSKAMNSQLRAPGSKPTRYARLCSAHFEESCFEVEMFSSTNGS